MKDDFGDRMKMYERMETSGKFMPGLPIYARIDGKCFSRFTQGLRRPFDPDMSHAMAETTKYLVEESGAIFGYTQSDEISLIFFTDNPKSQVFFDSKKHKMISVLAALATAKFNQVARSTSHDMEIRAESLLPVFDCRVFQLPSKMEASNAILWRVKDAVKNSISMSASAYYSPKQLHGKTSKQRQEMLWQKGINWNDYPTKFKEGTFVQRKTVLRDLSDDEISLIPEQYRPDGPIERNDVEFVNISPFGSISNRVGVIFDGEVPQRNNYD